MYHNRKMLLKAAVWLKVISWYYLLFGLIGVLNLINSSLNSFPALPFSMANTNFFQPPGWANWGSMGVLFLQQVANPIIYFLMFQGLASTIHFLLAYYHKKVPPHKTDGTSAGRSVKVASRNISS